jgi:hypothetical protein
METLQFSILINTGKRKVWDTMLEDKTYREWTREFHDGSCYEGSWSKGSEIRFLGPDDTGALQGLFSRIKDNIPYQFISIEHLGVVTNGVVDTTSDEVKKWAHSFENYTFIESGDSTKLTIDMQIEPDYKSMFEEMWPRALKALKALCEL